MAPFAVSAAFPSHTPSDTGLQSTFEVVVVLVTVFALAVMAGILVRMVRGERRLGARRPGAGRASHPQHAA